MASGVATPVASLDMNGTGINQLNPSKQDASDAAPAFAPAPLTLSRGVNRSKVKFDVRPPMSITVNPNTERQTD